MSAAKSPSTTDDPPEPLTLTVLQKITLAAALALHGCATTTELRGFTTDGCSLYPEGDDDDPGRWCECCVAHDRAYWRGGSAVERERADVALRECVLAATGRESLAKRMYRGVRFGGGPLWPTPFRWGYGWGYGRGYQLLSPAEQREADEKLAAYRPDQPVCLSNP